MQRARRKDRWPARVARILAVAIVLALSGCSSDPKSVEGALSRAASAVGSRDYPALFASLDERARFALGSVYRARKRAEEVIRTSYPPAAQPRALAELGDAIGADSEVELFRRRCGDDCLAALAAQLGAPRAVRTDGEVTVVETVRGTEARLYRASDGRYGLVWNTDALVRERTRAAAELDLIQKNGATYRSEQGLRTAPDGG